MLDYIAAFIFVALLGAVAGAVSAYTHRLFIGEVVDELHAERLKAEQLYAALKAKL